MTPVEPPCYALPTNNNITTRKAPTIYRNVEERIAAAKARVIARIPASGSGCWDWPGGTTGRTGYGLLNVRLGGAGAPQLGLLTHRVAYEHWVGPIPDGKEIDHLCRNHLCARPDHLDLVTRKENIERALTKADSEPCPMGHTEFWKRNAKGHRLCMECKRIKSRKPKPTTRKERE